VQADMQIIWIVYLILRAHPRRFERVTFAFEVLRLAACQHRRAPDLDYLGARQLVTDP